MKKDYSLYTYYKGSSKFPNRKAAYFGSYEQQFDNGYEGPPEDKEEAFKEFMSDLLYQKASDYYMFGAPGVDRAASLREFTEFYFNPEMELGSGTG